MTVRLLRRRWLGLIVIIAGLVGFGATGLVLSAQDPVRRDVTVTGRDHHYFPARIEISAGDILRITFVADDAPYTLAIDAYRIAKRATPGKPVVFEFRTDRAGVFAYYCDLSTDDACRDMRGELVVSGK